MSFIEYLLSTRPFTDLPPSVKAFYREVRFGSLTWLASYSSSRILYFVVPLVVRTRNLSFTLHPSFSLRLITDEAFMSCPLSLLKIFLPVPFYSGLRISVSVSWNRCLMGPFSVSSLPISSSDSLKKKKKKSFNKMSFIGVGKEIGMSIWWNAAQK